MRYFFTADTHFFHRNILRYSNRPFHSITQMNEGIVQRWNQQVSKDDRVYLLGDVSYGGMAETFRLLAELNGQICLIVGNHDDELVANPYMLERFEWVKYYHEEIIDGRRIVMFHYPILEWREAQRGSWHLYGHTHGSIQLKGAAMDVGIDTHPEYKLWSWQDIKKRLDNIPPLPYPKKHHNNKARQ